MNYETIIEEQGQGFPTVGEIVYNTTDNTIVMVESIDSGIFTQQWKNSYVHATVRECGDPTDLDDDKFNSLRNVTIKRE